MVWKRRAMSKTSILKPLLKTPRDEMSSHNDNCEKVKIFENTGVFTVKMHLGLLDNAFT